MTNAFLKIKNIIIKIWDHFIIGYITSHKRPYFSMINSMIKNKTITIKNVNKHCPRCGNILVVLVENPKFGFCSSYIETRNCPTLVVVKTNKDKSISYRIL